MNARYWSARAKIEIFARSTFCSRARRNSRSSGPSKPSTSTIRAGSSEARSGSAANAMDSAELVSLMGLVFFVRRRPVFRTWLSDLRRSTTNSGRAWPQLRSLPLQDQLPSCAYAPPAPPRHAVRQLPSVLRYFLQPHAFLQFFRCNEGPHHSPPQALQRFVPQSSRRVPP